MRRTGAAFLLAVAAVLSVRAERQPFERYQSVVDRQMFGPLPAGFDPTKPASEAAAASHVDKAAEAQRAKEQEKLKNAVRFSVINRTPGGETMVGFTDNTDSKNPKHYYLAVGVKKDGWLVKEADPVESKIVLVKDGFEIPLTMGGETKVGDAAKKPANESADKESLTGRSRRERGLLRRQALVEQRREEERLRRLDAERERERQERAEEREAAKAAQEAEKEAQREAEHEERYRELMATLNQMREDRKKEAEPREDVPAEGPAPENGNAEPDGESPSGGE